MLETPKLLKHNLKFGLCCLFHKEDIKFKTYTKASLLKLNINEQKEKILGIINHNIKTLQSAINYCCNNNIESYRVSSDLIPHFQFIQTVLYKDEIENIFTSLSKIDTKNITLSVHPGQHVNLGSPTEEVIKNSLDDLYYHGKLVESLNCLEINIHLGGTYGKKESAKERFIENFQSLYNKNITIENDELSYTVEDCLEVADKLKIPVTFDLHHHRCHSLKDDYISQYSEHELFKLCKQTWINAGYNYMRMHLSNPKSKEYRSASKSRSHSDIIYDKTSIPEWLLEESLNFEIHLDIEAKHKEVAIFDLFEHFK